MDKHRATICVRCLKRPAKTWCGHVLKDGAAVTAGWCLSCRRYEAGFVGHWRPEMTKVTP